jgi:hypothetical protein
MSRIKDKNGQTALDLVPTSDTTLRALIRKHQAQASVAASDIVRGMLDPHPRKE